MSTNQDGSTFMFFIRCYEIKTYRTKSVVASLSLRQKCFYFLRLGLWHENDEAPGSLCRLKIGPLVTNIKSVAYSFLNAYGHIDLNWVSKCKMMFCIFKHKAHKKNSVPEIWTNKAPFCSTLNSLPFITWNLCKHSQVFKPVAQLLLAEGAVLCILSI